MWTSPSRTAATLLLALHICAAVESDPRRLASCQPGYYQHEPVALGCDGGHIEKEVHLPPSGGPKRAFAWVAPAGTQNLSVVVQLSLTDGSAAPSGAVALDATCEGDQRPIVGTAGSVLNGSRLEAFFQGASWSWAGGADARQRLRVVGAVSCELQVSLASAHDGALEGLFEASWDAVEPCPIEIRGCEPCPRHACRSGQEAVCDGSSYWECKPVGRGKAPTAPTSEPPAPPASSDGGGAAGVAAAAPAAAAAASSTSTTAAAATSTSSSRKTEAVTTTTTAAPTRAASTAVSLAPGAAEGSKDALASTTLLAEQAIDDEDIFSSPLDDAGLEIGSAESHRDGHSPPSLQEGLEAEPPILEDDAPPPILGIDGAGAAAPEIRPAGNAHLGTPRSPELEQEEARPASEPSMMTILQSRRVRGYQGGTSNSAAMPEDLSKWRITAGILLVTGAFVAGAVAIAFLSIFIGLRQEAQRQVHHREREEGWHRRSPPPVHHHDSHEYASDEAVQEVPSRDYAPLCSA